MGLFSKKPNANKILDEALCDYKASRFEESYKKVCEACELGSARAYFCKALLIYNDSIAPGSEPDFNILKGLAKKAVDGGYTLAYGFYAYILHALGELDELCAFLSAKSKVRDGLYLSFKASYYFGLYTDDVMGSKKDTLLAIEEAIENLRALSVSVEGGKNAENEERSLYNPYTKFSIRYCYSHAHYVLFTIYYCEDDWSTRRAFMTSFDEIMKYMPLPKEKYNAASQYVKAILENTLGMSDFNEANRAMGILNECFNALSENDRSAVSEEYNELYDKYDEFYDGESLSRQSRDITYSDGYADKNDISIRSVAAAISEGAARWANTPSGETKTVYTINGRQYTRGEFGYLYDESNMRSDYKVDDYSRLYNENDTELGYFNNDGLFIGN